MEAREGVLARCSHFVHAHFLPLIIASYAVAALAPAAGLWIRDVSFGEVLLAGSSVRMGLPMLMLSALLLNAGLGVDPRQVGRMFRAPGLLGAGLAANLLVPIAFIFGIAQLMGGWHNAGEVQEILVGLALVAAMPIAGSSTAWSQNADGELALSLGLVLFSTLLSPLTTPLALRAVGLVTIGDYAEALRSLAAGGTGLFLALCVLAPALIGIGLRGAAGEACYRAARPGLKLANAAILLTLNYSNASVSLPKVIANPDLDFLAAALAIVAGLCALGFAAGWGVSRALRATRAQRASLMFGLGMNNNGTGLVLASMALADFPRAMLPIILYNLVQHFFAGIAGRTAAPTPPSDGPRASPAAPEAVPRLLGAGAGR